MKDYEKEYNDFWKDIVENKDGALNKDQIMRELSDYSMVMNNCASAYSTMTKGAISKQNTKFYEVESIFYECFIDYDTIRDDMLEILNTDNIEDLKYQIKDYFGIVEGDISTNE